MSGRRAAFKVAARNAAYNKKRTLFLVLLVAVPVALGVVVAGIVRASNFTPEENAQLQFGTADAQVHAYSQSGDVVDWIYVTTAEIDPGVAIVHFRQMRIHLEDYAFGLVTDIDLSDPLTEGMLVVLEGKPPTAAGEAAVSPSVAENMGLEVGDTAEFEDLDLGEFLIVGVVSEPIANSDSTILLSPGALKGSGTELGTTFLLGGEGAEQAALRLQDLWRSEGRQSFWPEPAVDPKPAELELLEDEVYLHLTESQIGELVELAENSDPENGFGAVEARAWEMVYATGRTPEALTNVFVEIRTQILNQTSFEGNSALVATGAAALLLIEVAFITGAAFAAGTRRRLREIGLMGANGATEAHVRTTVIGEGLTIGLVGSALGVLLGIGVLLLARPWLQRFVTRLITGLGVSLTDIVGPIAVALVSVLIAVWWPARTAAKIPTTTALQGRMPSSSPRTWTIPAGVSSAILGGLLITVSIASNSNFAPALVGFGGFLVVVGVAMLASPILAGVAKLADHVPATSRLVLRDSGRHRTRSSVAVAAIMVILLAPVIFTTVAATSAKQNLVYGLPEPTNHLLVSGSSTGFGGSEPIDDSDVTAVAAIVPERIIATFNTLELRTRTKEQLEIEGSTDVRSTITLGPWPNQAAVVTDSLLFALDDDRVTQALAADQIVVLGIEDKQTIVNLNGEEFPAVEFGVPLLRWAMPRVLLPESVAERYENVESRMMALLILERPMNDDEQRELWGALSLEIAGGRSSLSQNTLLAIAYGATMLVVLIVIALVTAVSAAEVDEELQTIVAVGAPGSIRRRFLGLLTGYQTLIAAALAVPLGLGLIKAFTSASQAYYQGPFGQVNGSEMVIPWIQIAGLATGIPLIVGLLTWATVRSAPVTPPRRAT